jgi:hypothetical protein
VNRWTRLSPISPRRDFVWVAIWIAALLPATAAAACTPGGKPSYDDVTSIYFQSQGTTAPIVLHLDEPVVAGDCPVGLTFLSTPTNADMGSGPVCFKESSGKIAKCCGGERFETDDAAKTIFERLLAVLKQDSFFEIPSLAEGNAPELRDFGTAAYYKIAVMRCGAQRRDPKFVILFGGPPEPAPNTTIFSIAVPLKKAPGTVYDKRIVTLLDDLTHAIYQSRWNSSDIY